MEEVIKESNDAMNFDIILANNINNTQMICTHKPCFRCMQILINSGINTVYYYIDYSDEFQHIFEKSKYVKFIKL